MSKYKMAPVYVGDIGDVTAYNKEKFSLPKELDISTLDLRTLCNLALAVGIDVRDIIGINTCGEHLHMVILGNIMPEGYNLFEHCVYCKNCLRYFRIARLD